VAALEQIVEDLDKLQQASEELHTGGDEPQLSEEVKLGFFRIAQEALNNVRKQVKASRVIMGLRFNL
jgi:signal transduction histidine kinase